MARVCMIVFSFYPQDARVRREAEALIEAGMSVDLICLQGNSNKTKEEVNGVTVYRVNLKRKRSGKLRYLWEYLWFTVVAFVTLSRLYACRPYHIVHVHNMPDILVFSAFLPKLAGAKVILDLHDPTPEVYMTKFSMVALHPAIRILIFLEKLSIKFSDLVITPNISFRDLFISRGCPPWKIHIIMNSPQENTFSCRASGDAREALIKKSGFRIMYHGLIVKRHGLDAAIKAMSLVRKRISNAVLHIYGEGNYLQRLKSNVQELNLLDVVKFHGYVPLEEIAAALAASDLGIVPNRMSPFTNLNLPTRIFECLIMGKPVIAPRTQGILDYFDEESLYLFEPGNVEELAKKIIEVYSNSAQRRQIVERGMRVYRQYTWKSQSMKLVNLYKRFLMNAL
ncbi:MAG: glycosyltransferase family 4 protein [Desulfobacteraceae bacterium]|nr:glycosyltransferase family 4 protein [Desulfobacteraceae bacterium]